MVEAESTRSALPVAEAAWVIPLAAVPIAGALTWGASGGTAFEEIGWFWPGALALFGALCSAYSARIVFASARPNGPPVALALLPFILPQAAAVLVSHSALQAVFNHGTYCGPVPREVVITGNLAEVLLYRAAPLFMACAGALTVALSAAYIARPLKSRHAWAQIAAPAALSWSLLVSALSVMYVRRKLLGMLDESFDVEATWLRQVVSEYREHQLAGNTLLLASLVFAAAAMNTRRQLAGVVTFVSLLVTALGVRSAEAIDAAQWRWAFEEYPLLETERTFEPSDSDAGEGSLVLQPWNHGRAAELVREQVSWARSMELPEIPETDPLYHHARERLGHYRQARALGLPFPGPGEVSLWRGVQDSELRAALQTFREEGVSDLVLLTPVAAFTGAPTALLPLVAYQDSFDTFDPLSVRFSDEEACLATLIRRENKVKTPAGLVSPWDLPCETIAVEDVSVARLHLRAAEATSRGHRLVVLVPRAPLE